MTDSDDTSGLSGSSRFSDPVGSGRSSRNPMWKRALNSFLNSSIKQKALYIGIPVALAIGGASWYFSGDKTEESVSEPQAQGVNLSQADFDALTAKAQRVDSLEEQMEILEARSPPDLDYKKKFESCEKGREVIKKNCDEIEEKRATLAKINAGLKKKYGGMEETLAATQSNAKDLKVTLHKKETEKASLEGQLEKEQAGNTLLAASVKQSDAQRDMCLADLAKAGAASATVEPGDLTKKLDLTAKKQAYIGDGPDPLSKSGKRYSNDVAYTMFAAYLDNRSGSEPGAVGPLVYKIGAGEAKRMSSLVDQCLNDFKQYLADHDLTMRYDQALELCTEVVKTNLAGGWVKFNGLGYKLNPIKDGRKTVDYEILNQDGSQITESIPLVFDSQSNTK